MRMERLVIGCTRSLAGIDIDPAAPGYKHILIQPQPGGGLTYARASHATMYGRVSSDWEIKNGRFDLAIEIPANTRATIRLPGATREQVTEGGKPLSASAQQNGDVVLVEVGSGQYDFPYHWKAGTN